MHSTWVTASTPTLQSVTLEQAKRTISVETWPDQKGLVDQLNGTRNVRYFEHCCGFVGDQLLIVSFYNLATATWVDGKWRALVDEATGENLMGGSDAKVDAMACADDRAFVVTTDGAVFEWVGTSWVSRGGRGDELFAKGRRFTRLGWDAAHDRVVSWGGTHGNRASNDTMLFADGRWRKAKKSSPKPPSLKTENFWIYPDAELGLVRVGPDEVSVLDGDVWTASALQPPPFVSKERRSQLVILHDRKSRKTRWLDPLTGTVYDARTLASVAQLATAPGLITTAALQQQGAYFSRELELVNERQWMWRFAPATCQVWGMCLGAEQSACTLDVAGLFC